MGFIDEHSLVVLSDPEEGGPPQLQIFDTEQENPTQTSLFLPTTCQDTSIMCLSLETCGNIPSQDELTAAPFYPDYSQRILAVYFGQKGPCYVINVELLLKLVQEREGQDVGWSRWGSHTIEAHVGGPDNHSHVWVSGCRLFCTVSDGVNGGRDASNYLRMYDFSHAGRAEYLHTLGEATEGGGVRRISPSLDGRKLPWNSANFCGEYVTIGHDSIAFWIVSIPIFLPTSSQLNGSCIRWPAQEQDPHEYPPLAKAALHVWSL